MNESSPQKLSRKTKPKKFIQREEEEEDPGCLALLKKISCSLQCGGTSCSIQETEPLSSLGSSLSASSNESLTSNKTPKAKPRKRQRSTSKPPAKPTEGGILSEGVVPIKKARRTPNKAKPPLKVVGQE